MRRLLVIAMLIVLTATPLAAGSRHIIQRGDTLSGLAVSHNVSTAQLAAHNGISNPDRIFVGMAIDVPGGGSVHVVQSGEVLGVIAQRYGVTIGDIQAANGITNAHRIFVGQRLNIPVARGSYTNLPHSITSRPERMAYIPLFEKYAAEFGLPPDLVMAVAFQESGWRQNVGNPNSSAVGIGQILIGTARFINEALLSPDDTRHTPEGNIRMMSAYLAWNIRELGSVRLGVGAYYQGIGSVKRQGIVGFTNTYVANVTEHRTLFT